MTFVTAFLSELDQEMASTRKILERVPEDRFAWKPHEKSPVLGKLANHIAFQAAAGVLIIKKRGTKPDDATTKAELLERFDGSVAALRELVAGMDDEQLTKDILVTPTISKPLLAVLRRVMNHLIHHRGQLSVYLRLLDVPVPGMYGPSADEKS